MPVTKKGVRLAMNDSVAKKKKTGLLGGEKVPTGRGKGSAFNGENFSAVPEIRLDTAAGKGQGRKNLPGGGLSSKKEPTKNTRKVHNPADSTGDLCLKKKETRLGFKNRDG